MLPAFSDKFNLQRRIKSSSQVLEKHSRDRENRDVVFSSNACVESVWMEENRGIGMSCHSALLSHVTMEPK